MTVHTIYRLGIWLPLLVPVVVAAVVHGIGVVIDGGAPRKIVQLLLSSLLYGGVPYAALAVWATWWIDGRPEPEISRLMIRARC